MCKLDLYRREIDVLGISQVSAVVNVRQHFELPQQELFDLKGETTRNSAPILRKFAPYRTECRLHVFPIQRYDFVCQGVTNERLSLEQRN
jgi:hypothetical protein